MVYLQREIHVEVPGPQKLDEESAGEAPDRGQVGGLQGLPPQTHHVRLQLLRVVRELVELGPVHVVLCSADTATGGGREAVDVYVCLGAASPLSCVCSQLIKSYKVTRKI